MRPSFVSVLTAFVLTVNIFAQDIPVCGHGITHSDVFKTENTGDFIGEYNGNLHFVDHSLQRINIDVVDKDGKMTKKPLSLKTYEGSKPYYRHTVRMEDHYLLILSSEEKKTKKYVILALEIPFTTLTPKGEYRKLFEMDYFDKFKIEYEYDLAKFNSFENGFHVATYKIHDRENKKLYEAYRVYDRKMTLLYEARIPYTSLFRDVKHHVNGKGELFILGWSYKFPDDKKSNAQALVKIFSDKGEKVKEVPLAIPKEVICFAFASDPGEKVKIAGLFTSNYWLGTNGVYIAEITPPHVKEYTLNLPEEFMCEPMSDKQRAKAKKGGLSDEDYANSQINDFMVSWAGTMSDGGLSMVISKTHNYVYTTGTFMQTWVAESPMVLHLTPDYKLSWSAWVPKYQEEIIQKRLTGEEIISTGDKLYVLWADAASTLLEDEMTLIKKPKKFSSKDVFKAVTSMVEFDNSGKRKRCAMYTDDPDKMVVANDFLHALGGRRFLLMFMNMQTGIVANAGNKCKFGVLELK